MKVADLRHRVRLQRHEEGQDEFGAPVKHWTNVATVSAEIEALDGREYFAAQQTLAESDHRVKIRYREDVTPLMRVMAGGRVFNITAALDRTGRRTWLELICKEAPTWQV